MRQHQNRWYDSRNTIAFLHQTYNVKCEYEYTILNYMAMGRIVFKSEFFHLYKVQENLASRHEDIPEDDMFNIVLWILDGFEEVSWVERNHIKPTYYRITEMGMEAWDRMREVEQTDSTIFPLRVGSVEF